MSIRISRLNTLRHSRDAVAHYLVGQRSRNPNLAQHLRSGYHGTRWTQEEIAQQGTALDEEVAARTGESVNAVLAGPSRSRE